MKFIQFTVSEAPDEIHTGYVVDGNGVVDINCQDSSTPTSMLQILQTGNLDKVIASQRNNSTSKPLNTVRLAAPIHGMDKILGVALNYADHCKAMNLPEPPVPIIFSKFASSIIGPNEPLRIRSFAKKVDWEIELAIIIGKRGTSVKAADANKYIFGYTIAQDISERQWQKDKNGTQFLLGKSQDTFCPIGPCIVTADEIKDPHTLDLSGETEK